jgi:O-antigen ligase
LAGFANGSSRDPHVSAQHRERFITRTLWIFAGFGAYLTFTALCEHHQIRSLIWPKFIADSSVGLNYGRARGPFAEAFAMALTLSFLFFVILFLARRCRTPMRILLWIFDLFVLLAIYFTYTRTAYVCLAVSLAVWLWLVAGRLRRTAAMSIIAAALIAAVAVNWATVSSKERTAGGLAEMRSIVGRIAVSRMALRLAVEEPLLGVGFGHYRQAVKYRQMDVASTTSVYARNLNQSVAVLAVLCETGLVGLILYLAVFFALLVPSIRLYRRCIPRANGFISRDFVVLFWILYLQTALMSVTADPSYYPYTTGLLMFFAGLVAGLEFSTREPAKSAEFQSVVPVFADPSVP